MTGYTAILFDKPDATFQEFALRCARAMGAFSGTACSSTASNVGTSRLTTTFRRSVRSQQRLWCDDNEER